MIVDLLDKYLMNYLKFIPQLSGVFVRNVIRYLIYVYFKANRKFTLDLGFGSSLSFLVNHNDGTHIWC